MNQPTISILLPVRNEEKFIGSCLEHIFQQTGLSDNVEIIVADGMSTDGTRKIVCDYQTRHPNLILIDNPAKIVPAGLNLAIQRSTGDVIIRIDGHTTIAPDYISQCVEALKHTQANDVGGKMTAFGDTLFGKAVALATSTPFGVGGARFHYSDNEEWVDTVYMGAWPRSVFEEIGLFDEELVRDQDDEFNYRLRAAGGKILLSPKIKSEYTVRSSPQALWKQYFQYGFWKVRVLQKHPRQMSLRQFVPPAFVLVLLGSASFLFFSMVRLLSLVVPLLYIVAALSISLWVASKHGWKYFPFLPFIFAILHLSYGLGFLVGMFKFARRWGDKLGRVPALGERNA